MNSLFKIKENQLLHYRQKIYIENIEKGTKTINDYILNQKNSKNIGQY
jgi:hypothetical protein